MILGLVGLLACLGCSDARPESPPVSSGTGEPGARFDATTLGAIAGRVTWSVDIPEVPPLTAPANPLIMQRDREKIPWPNPNAPIIDRATRGVKDAVVLLRGVDPQRARAWDHGPVRVVLRGQQFQVLQGEAEVRSAVVRRGDSVEMVSEDPLFHSLHASGAAFFTYPFPDANRPRRRQLTEKGIVELTSACGFFWMRSYLFVDDTPYWTRTDAAGRFELKDVPPGSYEIVCWMPDWQVERHERDPESSEVVRVSFRTPWERSQQVEVSAKKTREVEIEMSGP